MDLDRTQQRQLEDLLLRAFPTLSDIARLARYGLDENLQTISAATNLQAVVFDVIEWARAHDKIRTLITGACTLNSDYTPLREFAEAIPHPDTTAPRRSRPMLDIAALTTTVVTSFLLPYAKLGVEKLAQTLADKMGTAAGQQVSDLAGKVWDRVSGAFSAPKEQSALALFKDDPERMQAMVEKLLREKLAADSRLAEDLDRLVNSPAPGGTGAQIMNAAVAGILDMRGASNIHGGNFAGVMIGSPPPTLAPDVKPKKAPEIP